MPYTIKTVVEKQRGCGFKKPGGLYLIGGASSSPCCLLPFPLKVCRCCGQGVKFSRGFTWINTDLFTAGTGFESDPAIAYDCDNCFLSQRMKLGLMWVGESYYKTTSHFMNEARQLGISKRIGQLPRDCQPGKTWIALAHKKVFFAPEQFRKKSNAEYDPYHPAIFTVFKLTAVQYVVSGQDDEKKLQRLHDDGIELIQVIQEGQQQTIPI